MAKDEVRTRDMMRWIRHLRAVEFDANDAM